MKRLFLICATVLTFVGLTALPAAATVQSGSQNSGTCPGTSWYQSYGPDYGGGGTPYGRAVSSDYPYCWSQVKVYYTDGGGGHLIVGGWWQVSATLDIPSGGHLVYSDHNFWNTGNGQITGYRKYATWHA